MLSIYYQSIIEQISQMAPTVIFWIVLFLLILTLFTLYLALMIRRESSTQAIKQVDQCKKKVEAVEKKLDSVNYYLRDVFKSELGGAMDSFDTAVGQVLKEMKDELVQGVSKIEHIETAVRSRQKLNIQMSEGEKKIAATLGDPQFAKEPEMASDEAAGFEEPPKSS